MSPTEKLLRELIALPSVNPAFLPSGHSRAGESRVAELLGTRAQQAGLEVDWQRVLPGRDNLLVRLLPARKAKRRIVLAPHLDTVDGSDTQFVPRKSGRKLFGRGACDAKGTVAAMFAALCEVARSKSRPTETELVFAGLVDEEHGQAGSRALVESGFKADLAIVGEPTQSQVVTCHKGSLWVELRTRGKSAHGARPELGRNAVHEMARVVDWLQTIYAARLRRRRHRLLGCATVSVGVIRGGSQANIVPDECTIVVDRRTLPGETAARVRCEIQSLLRKHHLRARLVNGEIASCLPLEIDPGFPLVRQFIRCTGQRSPLGVHYFSDASVLAHGGIPSVVFGPGNIDHAHTAEEWIALDSLERARALLVRFFQSLA